MAHQIRELMTGLSEIPVVDENSTLFEAVLEIGIVRARRPGGARLPAALVLDKEKNVAGLLEFRHLLKALEPRYGEFVESTGNEGLSPDRLRAELKKYGLWEDALEGVCQKAGETSIKSLMTIPEEIQMADAKMSINEAVYRMIASGRDHLLVRDGRVLIGVVTLSDIMGHICDTVRACRM
jgi:CBS domain-containing protein